MSENEPNAKNLQSLLFNYLINYLTEHQNRNRSNLVTRVNRQVYEDFFDVCRRLGLVSQRGRANIALEALMQLTVEKFKDTARIVQTTLFYKPTISIEQKVEVNIAQKLEIKLIKKDLAGILQRLETKQGNQNFLQSRLRELLPKAIRIYDKTSDQEIEKLLTKLDKWV